MDEVIAETEAGSICVLAPWPILAIEIERAADGSDELYLHAGGQAFWVARMIVGLGLRATLCGPFGGETGRLVRFLAEAEGVATLPVQAGGWNGGYVHDRRNGERQEIASMPSASLNRHEADDLYGTLLAAGLRSRNVVLTGIKHDGMLPVDMFPRLARDLDANGVGVVADLSGAALHALDGGLDFLKVSHTELREAGYCADAEPRSLADGARRLQREKARNVVVSWAESGALACLDGRLLRASGPSLAAQDHTGAGDSMTAGLAVARAGGASAEDALRLAMAAGAINVTRRGRGTGDGAHVRELARHVELHEWRD
jgi:1-phosphofructokinase